MTTEALKQVHELFSEIPPADLERILTETRENYVLLALTHKDDVDQSTVAEHFYYLRKVIETVRMFNQNPS